jgi:hypothetical protein
LKEFSLHSDFGKEESGRRVSQALHLHDTINQTLFSVSLIADVLPRLWERDPMEGRVRLGELRELTQGAIAEMQSLLEELQHSSNSPVIWMEGRNATGRAGQGPEDQSLIGR